MKSILKVNIALSILLISSALYSQEFKTPLKVSKGQEFNYQTDLVADITQTMGGQEMKVNSTSNATTKYVVNNVLNDGSVEVLTSIWDAKSITKAPMMDTTMVFDGKVSPTYKVLISKYGKIISRESVDTTGLKPGSSNFNMENSITSSGLFCDFPEKDIKVGEKWSKSISDSITSMGGKLGFVSNTDYTLGAKETIDGQSLQKITYTSSIEIGGKSKMQGMDLFIEGTGVKNGSMYIDPVSKVVYEDKSNVELDMTVAVSGQQSMTIPMTQKMAISQKLKK